MVETFKILIANGVNLDLLGQRDPSLYGNFSLSDLETQLQTEALELVKYFGVKGIDLNFFSTNDESKFLAEISKEWDGAVINAGAWTHTSLALGDRLASLPLPFVEVHISNLSRREAFRQKSFLAPHATGVIYGLGLTSYSAGLYALLHKLRAKGD